MGGTVDEQTERVAAGVADYLEHVVEAVREGRRAGTPLARAVGEHLGTEAGQVPVVTHRVDRHQHVNLDVALEALVSEHGGGTVIGVGGGDQRHHSSFSGMLEESGRWGSFTVGAVERVSLPTGPHSQREAVSFGVHLFRYRGTPVAVLESVGEERFGGVGATLQVAAAEGVAQDIVADVRRLVVERSVFRGQILTLGSGDDAYTPSVGGIGFHPRPTLTRQDVVLPAGSLERVERHVVGTAQHRDVLRAAGQHLKRGLLLYGPPGTGKTHTVRYLLGHLEGVTTVLLSGTSLRFVGEAVELARALEPAVVVLEDVDLVAESRDLSPDAQPLLFTVLEAMDGLGGDADVAFVLTTNRADLLEPALAQRPGRVDLAVEVPLPDDAGRRALAGLYGRDLPFGDEVLEVVAARTAGMTASFFKELVRRSVLVAAEAGHPVTDDDLGTALDELLDEREALTRSLLGGAGGPAAPQGPGAGPYARPFGVPAEPDGGLYL